MAVALSVTVAVSVVLGGSDIGWQCQWRWVAVVMVAVSVTVAVAVAAGGSDVGRLTRRVTPSVTSQDQDSSTMRISVAVFRMTRAWSAAHHNITTRNPITSIT